MAITYERLRELRFLGVTMDTQACANCEHFYQHYHKDGSLIFAGHCCYPRMKYRNPNDTCDHFKNKTAPASDTNTCGGKETKIIEKPLFPLYRRPGRNARRNYYANQIFQGH